MERGVDGKMVLKCVSGSLNQKEINHIYCEHQKLGSWDTDINDLKPFHYYNLNKFCGVSSPL
jgi:hypothetical protein